LLTYSRFADDVPPFFAQVDDRKKTLFIDALKLGLELNMLVFGCPQIVNVDEALLLLQAFLHQS
jgi:hypothetical protein